MTSLNTDEIRELTAAARFGRKKKVSGRDGVIVSSHPIVSRVGADVLRAGGNAVDALLAAAVAQTVVEPHMTTIFGVLSVLHHDAGSGETSYLNGSMNAPLAPLPGFGAADLSNGRSVAVPGFWAAYEAARERWGTKGSAELLEPAISLCRTGFPVYPFLHGMMFEQINKLGITAEGRETYYRDNALLGPGELLVQHRLADTLEQLAAGGAEYFYRSDFTQRVVDAVAEAGGVLTLEDFDRYEVRWVDPAWGTYRGHRIAASPPPDNGGTHVVEILNLVEQIPLREWGRPTESPDTLYWLARFCGEVQADGARHPDPNSFPLPLDTILSKEYAALRYELMQMSVPLAPAPDATPYPGSNHLTVIDRDGNVATALHSVMSLPWSNGLIVDGVNVWAGGAHFVRRMPKPGDRATCYVAPTILFDGDRPLLAAGSPSVGLVPNLVQNTINILDFGVDIEESVHIPRVGGLSLASYGNPFAPPTYYCEVDCGTPDMQAAVRSRGVNLDIVGPWNFHSGSYEGIHVLNDGTAQACGDPRRAGQPEAL